jgi:hypothetical protein
MYPYERKRILVSISILCILGLNILPLVQFITQFRDPDFSKALDRAKNQGYSQMQLVHDYPFMPIKRGEAAIWFVETATILKQECLILDSKNPACFIKDI